MSSSSNIIQVSGLTKQVTSPEGTLTLLDDLHFSIDHGSAVAIIGASGSGKSTLLGLLAGLDTPTSGQVIIDDTDLFALNEDQRAGLRKRLISFVFQSFQLLSNLNAVENVMLPLELRGDDNIRERALAALDRVGLSPRVLHYPRQLSGGEQQRVAIARAYVTQPTILFADEPTGNLDSVTSSRVIELLFDINQQSATTLVMVTHDPSLANACHRSLHLDAGRLSETT